VITRVVSFQETPTCLYAYLRLVSEGEETLLGETVAFNTKQSVWTTRYSFKPECMIGFNDRLFTFREGVIYKHSEEAPRLRYYGTNFPMTFDLVSNYDPSKTKFYKAVGIEGDVAADIDFTIEEQTTFLGKAAFSEKERQWFASLPRSVSDNWSNYVFLGVYQTSKQFWLLEFGQWNDTGIWNDDAVWVDYPTAQPVGANGLVFSNLIKTILVSRMYILMFTIQRYTILFCNN
jgi:hypothetical protein